MGRWVSAPLAACLLALAAAGCTGRAVSASIQSPARSATSAPTTPVASTASPSPSASAAPATGTSAEPGRPLPAGTAARLAAGAFYLLAGPGLGSLNVWEAGSGRSVIQVTHNRAGHGIDALAASDSGIIVADAAHGTDRLARWTRHGLSWLRHGRRGPLILGSSPDIRGNGTIGYVTPPSGSGAHRDANFAIWTQPSFTARATVVYRQRRPLDGPVFGPHGEIAVEGWTGPEGGRRPTMLIYRDGQVARLSTGVPAIPSLLAWGHRAPALAVAFPGHRAELLFTDGRRQPLPSGWQPLAWNPSGTQLLMQSATALGIWSATAPGRVRTVGVITPGVQILQAVWLSGKAPM
ncbi:MAG: hypothetical protein ACR2MP_19500 [Streptosporangiaceae bacterium]